ncbi:hypothetical protein MNBD_GAMMA16-2045 [hydrothermal vent metagenome]|uniref:Uncharacterized protein n=1 Tax=hydrothermal vent metagenome TaxID=652676 RepID=A0A3B0YW43_9ZZZZ
MASDTPYFGKDLKQRLTLAGLDKDFKEATVNRNEALMVSILCQVTYTQQQARDTTKNLLLDPSYYLNNA